MIFPVTIMCIKLLIPHIHNPTIILALDFKIIERYITGI